jgi:ketosteroid isomerase-like protein/quercetin dioxygenase-like cupin family protein
MKLTTRIPALVAAMSMAMLTLALPAFSQTKAEREIRAASSAWQRYIAAQQTDSIVAMHLPNAILMMANSPPVMGSNGIRAGWGDIVKLPNLAMHWTPQHIEVISPTAAQEFGTYTDSYDGPNGKESDAGTYITLWKKVNGKWRVALDVPVSSMPVQAAAPAEATEFVGANAASLAWNDFALPGFPAGGKITVLHGDPSKAGRFVLRLSFPDGYQVPLHWHPTAEYVTILSGGVNFGMGNTVDASAAQPHGPGDFAFIPARHAHWLTTRGATIVEVSGNGPFQLNLGAPK